MSQQTPGGWEDWLPIVIAGAVGLLVFWFGYEAVRFLFKNPWLLGIVIIGSSALLIRRFLR